MDARVELPPADRTVGQLVAETIRLFGGRFWRSLALGLGIQAAPPGAFDAIAPAIRVLVTDGIVMGILLAMVLNIVLPRDTGPKPAAAH